MSKRSLSIEDVLEIINSDNEESDAETLDFTPLRQRSGDVPEMEEKCGSVVGSPPSMPLPALSHPTFSLHPSPRSSSLSSDYATSPSGFYGRRRKVRSSLKRFRRHAADSEDEYDIDDPAPSTSSRQTSRKLATTRQMSAAISSASIPSTSTIFDENRVIGFEDVKSDVTPPVTMANVTFSATLVPPSNMNNGTSLNMTLGAPLSPGTHLSKSFSTSLHTSFSATQVPVDATLVPTVTATLVPAVTAPSVSAATATLVPSVSATLVPSVSATLVPSVSATLVPLTSASQVPSTSASQVPTVSASQVPTVSATLVPFTSASQVPCTSATQVPSTSAIQVPSTSAIQVPSTSAT